MAHAMGGEAFDEVFADGKEHGESKQWSVSRSQKQIRLQADSDRGN
jgi:hypothetical protein